MKSFHKVLFMSYLFFCILAQAFAQPIASYTFSTGNAAYQPLSGGTVLGDTLNEPVTLFNNIPLGFAFNYGGINVNSLSVSVCGSVKLGGSFTEFSLPVITEETGSDTVIAVLGSSILRPGGDGEIRYNKSGTAPNQVFTVQWKNYNINYDSNSINFQLKLYESSNKIEFHYGEFDLDTNSQLNYFQIGLRGNLKLVPGDFFTRMIDPDTNTWATSRRGFSTYDYAIMKSTLPEFKPANGLLFSFFPPASCSGTPQAGTIDTLPTTLCDGQKVNLNLNGASGYETGRTYTWQSSPNGASNWTTLASHSFIPFSPTYSGSTTFYRAKVSCLLDTATTAIVSVNPVSQNVGAVLPLLETFDNLWQNRCGTADVPNVANWSSNPSTGALAWVSLSSTIAFLPATAGSAAVFQSGGNGPSAVPNEKVGDFQLHLNLAGSPANLLSFIYTNPFADDSLEVFYSANDGASFESKGMLYGGGKDTNNNKWSKKSYILIGGNANSIVRFRAYSNGFGFAKGIDSVEVTAITSVSNTLDGNLSDEARLYPNPTSGNFHLVFQKAADRKIQIFNAEGKQIEQIESKKSQVQVDRTDLKPGIYFAKIQIGHERIQVLRFVKK